MNDLSQKIDALIDDGYSYYDILETMAKRCKEVAKAHSDPKAPDATDCLVEASLLRKASQDIQDLWREQSWQAGETT